MRSSLFAIQIKALSRCYTSNGWIYCICTEYTV